MRVSLIKISLMQFLCALIVLMCSAFSELHAQPSGQLVQKPRIEIALFQYRGVVTGDRSEQKFGTFRGIIEQKLLNLKKDVLQTWPEEEDNGIFSEQLNKIHIRFRLEDNFTSDEGIFKWMENQKKVLSVMRGSINSDDERNYNVQTWFYLGKSCEYLPYKVICFELPIKSSEYKNTQDSHTLVILYALAMDAKSLGFSKDRIALYLKTAEDKISDLERRNKDSVSKDLADLIRAIRKSADELLGTP